jgi:multidrug efflux pump subunit AcrA (membrane-fusion protein)
VRRRIIATWTLALGALLAVACSRGAGGDHDAEKSDSTDAVVDVRVASVQSRAFRSSISAPGQWRSSGELAINAPFAGVLESLKPRVGDSVREGETIGRLVTRESWSALHGAELMTHEVHDSAGRAEAEHALELARHDLVRVPIVASKPGLVVRRTLEPGDQVAESAEILALVPTGNLVFEAHVPAGSDRLVRPGQPATVTDQDGTTRAASVQRILPMANDSDQSRLVWLSARAGNPAPLLDRYGEARILLGLPHPAPAVPDSAIVEDDLTGQRRVAVVGTDGRMRWNPVELGMADAGWHEVVKPALAPGTRVVISGQRGLASGTRVKLTP